MGEQLEARKDEALTAVEEAIYGALKRADLLREVGPFLRQILALEALGAVLSVVRAESGQPSSVPSSPHETGLTAEQKARIEGIVDGVLEGMDSASAPSAAPTNSGAGSRSDSEGEEARFGEIEDEAARLGERTRLRGLIFDELNQSLCAADSVGAPESEQYQRGLEVAIKIIEESGQSVDHSVGEGELRTRIEELAEKYEEVAALALGFASEKVSCSSVASDLRSLLVPKEEA